MRLHFLLSTFGTWWRKKTVSNEIEDFMPSVFY
jgi:hypothetical protein